MAGIQRLVNGLLESEWDDDSRTWRRYDPPGSGVVVEQRAYTAEENAEADVRAAQLSARANLAAIRERARTALTVNRAYLDLPAPSNAQVVEQVAALTRQTNGLIRLAVGALDGTD